MVRKRPIDQLEPGTALYVTMHTRVYALTDIYIRVYQHARIRRTRVHVTLSLHGRRERIQYDARGC